MFMHCLVSHIMIRPFDKLVSSFAVLFSHRCQKLLLKLSVELLTTSDDFDLRTKYPPPPIPNYPFLT